MSRLSLLNQMPDTAANKHDPLRTLNALTYNLGSLTRALYYAQYGDVGAYNAEARIATADMVTILRLLAEQIGWNWEGLVADGSERFGERMDEIAKGELGRSRAETGNR